MAGLDGVNPALANAFLRIQAAAAQSGYNIGIGSGYRTPESQATLRIKNGCPDVYSSPASSCRVPTAIPGKSNHQHGLAIDISGSKAAKAWVNANGAKFGVHFPVSGEDWHMELLGSEGHYQGGQQMGGIGFDLNWQEQGKTPEQTQDELLQSFVDVIAGAEQDSLLGTPGAIEVETPGASEVATPAMAQNFSPGAAGTEAAAPIAMDTVNLQGQPGAAPAGGGAFTGKTPPPGYVPPGQGVGRWRDVAIAALRYTGQDPGLVDILLKRMAQESGGNPGAVNNWDSNAKRGDPSKGLMQNIGSAFPERARELSNRGIFDGFANIVASIRYTLNRYGSLASGWSRKGGY